MKLRIFVLLLLVAPAPALGDGARDLQISAEALRSADPRVRVEAAERLSTLGRAELPAIDAHLESLKRRAIDPEEGYQALRRFAHAAGSRRADDPMDIEPGIKAKLEAERPSAVEAAVAEELLLLRSLEKIGSSAAYRRAVRIFALHYDVFRWESRHSSRRMGMRALPALLDGAAHGDAGLAEWASQSLDALGRPTPADALRALEGDDRAELLRAYAERRIMDAMESVAAFIDDPDPVVRHAAVAAVRRYGRNAIWQIRDMARILLGEDLDHSWGAERSLEHLVQKLEDRRLAPQREAVARAAELSARGELSDARALIGPVLAERPKMREARIIGVEIFAALAERALGEGQHLTAAQLFVEAALIAPEKPRSRELLEASGRARAAALRERGQFHPSILEREASSREASVARDDGGEAREVPRGPVIALLLGIFLLTGVQPLRWIARLLGRTIPRFAAVIGANLVAVARVMLNAGDRLARALPDRIETALSAIRRGADGTRLPRRSSSDLRPAQPRREPASPPTPAREPRASRRDPKSAAKLPVEIVFGPPPPRGDAGGGPR